MAKISKEAMKADEKKVMHILEQEGNLSMDALAKKAGFSRQKVWRITNRLEKSKTVYGYHAVVDRAKTQTKKFFVMVKLTMQPIESYTTASLAKDDLQKKAEKYGASIDSLYFVQGRCDFLLTVIAESIVPVKKFCYGELIKTLKQIKSIEFLEELVTIKEDSILHPKRETIKEFFI